MKRVHKHQKCLKKAYLSPRAAWEFATYFYRRYGQDQQPYKCEKCRRFHLTHKMEGAPEWYHNKLLKIHIHRHGKVESLKKY